MTIAPARGHSSATLYEAAVSEWRYRARGGTPMPEVAVDPAVRAWGGATVAGRAFTIRGTGGDNLALHRAVLCASPGDVLVADLGGSQHGHWGEILSVAAQQRGIVGLVIDGGVRDRDQMRAIGFPVRYVEDRYHVFGTDWDDSDDPEDDNGSLVASVLTMERALAIRAEVADPELARIRHVESAYEIWFRGATDFADGHRGRIGC